MAGLVQQNRRKFLQGSVATVALPHLTSSLLSTTRRQRSELWYSTPANRWQAALPIGNGRLGAMIFGGTAIERIALSESTAWSGAPGSDEVNPGAVTHLQEIRELFFAGKYEEAQNLCGQFLPGRAKNFGTNLPLPEVQFKFNDPNRIAEYRRALDLETALARASFRSGDALYEREALVSHVDGILAFRLTCSRPGHLGFRLQFGSTNLPHSVHTEGNDTLLLDGHCYEPQHSSGKDGVAFQIRVRLQTAGGELVAAGSYLTVRDANAVTVLVAVGTSFQGTDPAELCMRTLRRAEAKSYEQIRRDHIADYQPLYQRVSISLGESRPDTLLQPTDVRRRAFAAGADDPELIALFFQYGRYLTIAGSRADSPLPLALQGIWNDGLASSMGWTDDFHLDINTQQNYWAAEVCNLSECQRPLFGLIELLSRSGRETARQMYGAPGWVVHTVTNPWGFTAPGSPGWGIFVTAGIWIALQMWEHYAFTDDLAFLRDRAYPVLREAAKFFLAYMVLEPKHGWLVTGPSDSPENWYVAPDGHHLAESMGNTVDRVFVHALYSMCIEAAKALSQEDELCARLEAALAKLPPFQIGRHGQLQEWLEDYEDAEPNHRHTSHLTALYPEHQISPRTTPALARAAEVTIQRRINAPNWEQSEWGRANLIVYYAKLLKGNDAHRHLVGLLAKSSGDNLLTYSSAGIAGAQSEIFAIDGNTAGAAGIAEMLLQSQADEIELLPALPAAWQAGEVRGLRARGGFTVDIAWKSGKLLHVSIVASRARSTPVRYRDRIVTLRFQPGQKIYMCGEHFYAPQPITLSLNLS